MQSDDARQANGHRCNAVGAAKQLTEWIASAKLLLHGQLPPERQLASLLQLPRGTLREALQMLEDDGRIWRRVGMGTFVGSRPQSIRSEPEALGAATTLSEILEARLLIEPIMASLAAQRAGQPDIAMLEDYQAQGAKSRSWADWEKWDNLFHRAVVEATGNGLLISAIDHLLRIKMHPRWTIQRARRFDPILVARYSNQHKAVVCGIIGRDCAGAAAAMRGHMLGLSLTVGPAIAEPRQTSGNRAAVANRPQA